MGVLRVMGSPFGRSRRASYASSTAERALCRTPQTNVDMSRSNVVAATFSAVGNATAAVDWFRNQAVDPDAIGIMAVAPGEKPRRTQPGDNQRPDLSWIV